MPFFDYPNGGSEKSAPDATFLQGANGRDWDTILALLGIETFVAQQILIERGTPGEAFFILIDGAVDVLARGAFGDRLVAQIAAGSVFGEISFLDGGTRTATIRAARDGSLVRVTHDAFTLIQAREPHLAQRMLFDLARICAQRLRRTIQRSVRAVH